MRHIQLDDERPCLQADYKPAVLMQIHRRDSVLVISSFFLSCVCLLVRSFVRSLSVSLVRSTKVATLEPGEDISIQLQNSDATVNGHGRKLLRLCGEAAMVLCTGRTTGDTPAQPSYRARSNTEPSRCLHSLSLSLSPGPCIGWLWPFSCSPDLQGWYSPAGVRPLPLGAAAASHSSCASGKPASTSGFHPHLGVGWRPAGSLCGCPHVRAMPDPYR